MKGLIGWLVLIIAALILSLVLAAEQIKEAEARWKVSEANVKAYSSMLDNAKKSSIAYQFTIDQLKYLNDSILKKLENTRKELGIKDKNTQAVQYIESGFTRVDTIHYKDTIFRQQMVSKDTTIGDNWYTARLQLNFPSDIVLSPSFKSEKHIVVSTKKETVNPPKKFFLFRWFQKRHTVLRVDVVEKNPYVENEISRYIDVIK